MKELNLKLTGYRYKDNVRVNIDGNEVKFIKDKSGDLTCSYQTENERVKIQVFRLLNVGGYFWFLTQLFFFLITLFGLLGTHYKEKCLVLDCEMEVDLKEKNSMTITINTPVENEKAVEVQTQLPVTEISNKVFVDSKAIKTLKKLKIVKFFLAIAIIATVLLLLL